MLFWYQEVQYWKATPVPENYTQVHVGETIEHEDLATTSSKFIHFYNPDCPCSKFNFKTYQKLVHEHGSEFELYFVLPGDVDELSSGVLEDLERENVTVLVDKGKEIAKACGVYSTPQLVLLKEGNVLFYRGNYNKSRFCTGKQTSYAKMAIESLVYTNTKPELDLAATRSYGCELFNK